MPFCFLDKPGLCSWASDISVRQHFNTSVNVLRVQIVNNCCYLVLLKIKNSCCKSFCWISSASSIWRYLPCSLPWLSFCLPFLCFHSLCWELIFWWEHQHSLTRACYCCEIPGLPHLCSSSAPVVHCSKAFPTPKCVSLCKERVSVYL